MFLVIVYSHLIPSCNESMNINDKNWLWLSSIITKGRGIIIFFTFKSAYIDRGGDVPNSIAHISFFSEK